VYKKLILFFGVGVLFWLVPVVFLPFLRWVAVGVGGCCGGCCCCLSLFYGPYPLPVYPSPVPVFFNIKLSVLKRLKVFKHPYKGNNIPTPFKANK